MKSIGLNSVFNKFTGTYSQGVTWCPLYGEAGALRALDNRLVIGQRAGLNGEFRKTRIRVDADRSALMSIVVLGGEVNGVNAPVDILNKWLSRIVDVCGSGTYESVAVVSGDHNQRVVIFANHSQI
jgi:hypothetical protein